MQIQDYIVWAIGLLALAYLVWHFWPKQKAPGCAGGCSDCHQVDWQALTEKAEREMKA
ncbi:hypothetical protein SapgrDRAFT_1186 [Saprospira grandis DSM 2844]|uniref:Uncharacterized protein n=1 Tax=Saprospira grandis DSM 2844 TaxID=694433 RepID=J1I2I3_9BACT|nr:FeoB-associated Cys-rich membrane protein [Saprospira grandis]EJF52910.1 hypothetical protein SapgrDRAFT_1186 [Saprospira grandis DSM 2844]